MNFDITGKEVLCAVDLEKKTWLRPSKQKQVTSKKAGLHSNPEFADHEDSLPKSTVKRSNWRRPMMEAEGPTRERPQGQVVGPHVDDVVQDHQRFGDLAEETERNQHECHLLCEFVLVLKKGFKTDLCRPEGWLPSLCPSCRGTASVGAKYTKGLSLPCGDVSCASGATFVSRQY